ncbi:hypothetical protein TWF696_002573 [Orbilia brochopaga]|uniref:3-phytase n=1 Tax=Orbilia brochopaga TaxID=3140254 RepID=A0AAV9U501_9PEZI
MKHFVSYLGALQSAMFYTSQEPEYQERPESPILTDLNVISQYWGQISPYSDNDDGFFGVQDLGLPNGCGVEQAHILHRHAERFPTSSFADGLNNENFGQKVLNWTTANTRKRFTGPLAFLNSWKYQMAESYLTGIGAATAFQSGVAHWNRYGRVLYNATAGQLAYNTSVRPKPVLRTTSQSRIQNSQINWALGFFGPSFSETAIPSLANATSAFNVVIIPEGNGDSNNTLASYDSCPNGNVEPIVDMGDRNVIEYVAIYLREAVIRLQQYAPSGFTFNVNDTYAMQSICAYETGFLGDSDFCRGLFTSDEWAGFENTLDLATYYDCSWGNPTGRAQGIGYLQELIARLTNQYITSSNSSANSTLDSNPNDFPLRRPFYADFTHDNTIISLLTAMSLDYFKKPPSLSQFPPDPNGKFIVSHLIPSGARLVTEVVGCAAANPTAVHHKRQVYYQSQYGYNASISTNKFIRMRLNNGILPLSSIRGGACAGRSDGLCEIQRFLQSQANATALANYQYACFGNYTVDNPTSGKDYDGTIFAKSIRYT